MATQSVDRTFLSVQEEITITPDLPRANATPATTATEPSHVPPPLTATPPIAPALAPAAEEDEPPLHLDFPAPTFEQVGERISKWGMRLPGFSAEWQTRGEIQCIRSKITAVSRTIAISFPGLGATAGEVTLSRSHEFLPRVHADLEVGGQKIIGHQGSHVTRHVLVPAVGVGAVGGDAAVSTSVEAVSAGEDRRDGVLLSGAMDWAPVGFRYEKSAARPGELVLVSDKIPPYVVLGIFSGADGIPHERMISIRKPSLLFWYIFWAIVRLRGISWVFSLKDVKSFAVYRCNWKTGVHKQVPLEQKGINDLRLLLLAYKSWWNSDRIGIGWTTWIQKTINNGSSNPRSSPDGNELSIEVVLGWSAFRISVVILLPTVLSLAVGLWFNSRDWNDLSTIQSAWGIASYVATAGGLIAALLAIVSGINDK